MTSRFMKLCLLVQVRGPEYACPHLDYFSTPLPSDSKATTPSSAISSSAGLKHSIRTTPKKKSNGQMMSGADKHLEVNQSVTVYLLITRLSYSFHITRRSFFCVQAYGRKILYWTVLSSDHSVPGWCKIRLVRLLDQCNLHHNGRSSISRILQECVHLWSCRVMKVSYRVGVSYCNLIAVAGFIKNTWKHRKWIMIC